MRNFIVMFSTLLMLSACTSASSNYYERQSGVANNYFMENRIMKF